MSTIKPQPGLPLSGKLAFYVHCAIMDKKFKKGR